MKRPCSALLVFLLSSCGTFSYLRPADTLSPGQVDVTGGISASGIEGLPVLQAAVGVVDSLELVGQYEVYSGFAEARWQLLKAKEQGVSLTLGAGGGFAQTFEGAAVDALQQAFGDEEHQVQGMAGTGSIALGWPLGKVDLWLAHRSFLMGDGFWIASQRLGVRFPLGWKLSGIVEGGASVHGQWDLGAYGVFPEGTAALNLRF